MLEAHGLVKRYRGRTVVDDVSLKVERGRVVGLLGPNGAGKTTCFYMVVGLVPCNAGSITLDGRELRGMPMHMRARMGLVYLQQEPSVFRRLTVEANVNAALELRKDLDRQGRRAELERLLDELQIGHLADRRGLVLSGGERRRVEIARALAARPSYMLLDEPFAGVDPIAVADIQRIVRHLTDHDIGILMTDHNVRETLGLCDHAYILNEGRILADGRPRHILENRAVRDVYLGSDFAL